MDVSAVPRPHSTPRPTQQYYVPRRLLECGRGPLSKTDKNEEKVPKSPPPSKKSSAQRSPKSQNPPPKNNNNNSPTPKSKPRPLMEHILAPPPSLQQKEKKVKFLAPIATTTTTKKSSSTPNSSRSSSSMSSSMSSPSTPTPFIIAPPNGVTKSTPRVLRPQKYARNPFAPTISAVSHGCNCDRSNTHIFCQRCGYECIGRVHQTCGVHPLIIALDDLRECPNSTCKSTQIIELGQINSDDLELIEKLSEPIHKIDLLSDD